MSLDTLFPKSVIEGFQNFMTSQFTPKTTEEAYDFIVANCRQIMMDKQAMRGTANIEQQGQIGVANRMSADKMTRVLKHIEAKRNRELMVAAGVPMPIVDQYFPQPLETAGEGLLDDCADIANYAIILIMLERGWWGLPLQSEVEVTLQ